MSTDGQWSAPRRRRPRPVRVERTGETAASMGEAAAPRAPRWGLAAPSLSYDRVQVTSAAGPPSRDCERWGQFGHEAASPTPWGLADHQLAAVTIGPRSGASGSRRPREPFPPCPPAVKRRRTWNSLEKTSGGYPTSSVPIRGEVVGLQLSVSAEADEDSAPTSFGVIPGPGPRVNAWRAAAMASVRVGARAERGPPRDQFSPR